MFRKRQSSGNTPSLSDDTPHFLFSPPTAKIEIQLFSSFQSLLSCEPATATHFIQTPLISLLASATSFTALTATHEVLTFGSPLHPQSLGRDPTVNNSADSPCAVSFLGGIPIRKIAVGGWIGAAVSGTYISESFYPFSFQNLKSKTKSGSKGFLQLLVCLITRVSYLSFEIHRSCCFLICTNS